MSEQLIKAVEDGLKGVEVKLGERLAQYEGQLKEAGDVARKTAEDLKSLAEQHKELSGAITEIAQKGVKLEQEAAVKSFGQEFIESAAFKSFKDGGTTKARMELKNTILGEAGSPQDPVDTIVPADRMLGIVGGAFRALGLLDFVPQGVTSSNSVEYTRESSWTNDAGETKEGASKPESDLTFELVNSPVRTIAHWIKVSKQVMDDAPALASYIDRRLRHGVLVRLQNQIVAGNGTSPNLSGILDSGNFTSVTAATGDHALDFANRLKYAVIGADYAPSFYLINPADWGAMERLKKGTGDESYIGAEGAISYLQNGLIPMLWGLPVVASNSVTQGQLVCAASDAMMLWNRQGVAVEMYEQDDVNVQKNLITIRAEMRAAFSVFRAAAIRAGTIPT